MSVNLELIGPETGEPQSWERGHVSSYLVEAAKMVEQEKGSINVPNPAKLDRAKQILRWLTWLPHRTDEFIVMRSALGFSSRSIGRSVGKSHNTCLRRNIRCLDLIADRLNELSKPWSCVVCGTTELSLLIDNQWSDTCSRCDQKLNLTKTKS